LLTALNQAQQFFIGVCLSKASQGAWRKIGSGLQILSHPPAAPYRR
jgi:hypothetical protein